MLNIYESWLLTCLGDYRLKTLPVPEPGPKEILVKVKAVGVCASDVKCYSGAEVYWGKPGSTG